MGSGMQQQWPVLKLDGQWNAPTMASLKPEGQWNATTMASFKT
jgi:hypothetical protein